MTQASGVRTRLSFVEETTLGTTPTSPATKFLPFVSEGLGTTHEQLVSASNRGERAVRDIRPGGRDTKGDINFELDAGTWGTLFKHLLGSNATTGIGPYTHTIKGANALPAGGISIEKAFLDLAKYMVFRGCRVQSLNLTLPSKGYITGVWNILALVQGTGVGATAGVPGATSIDTVPDDISDQPMVEWEGALLIDSVAVNRLASMGISIENGINEDGFTFGTRDRYEMTPGQRVVKLNPTFHLENMDDTDAFYTAAEKVLKVTITRGTLSIELLFPKVVFGGADGTPKVGGKDPITILLPCQAKYDATEATDVKVTIINNVSTI